MPVKTIGTGRGLMGGGTYADKVRGLGPIAYWPLWEKSGTTAQCLVGSGLNGFYNSNVSGWPPGAGIGDGNTAPYFDGANDYVSLIAAAIQAAANTATTEGSIAAWYRVTNAGTWTDATYRAVYAFVDDANNRYIWYKSSANNTIYALHYAGGTGETMTLAGQTATTWQHCVMTWSQTADQVKYYLNGAWVETDTTIGIWNGDGTWAPIMIGATAFAPSSVWSGWIAHVALFNRPLVQAEVSAMAAL